MLSVERLFRSPFARASGLFLAALASIATSAPEGPSWTLSDASDSVEVTLEPRETFERRFSFEASHPVRVSSRLSEIEPRTGRLQFVHDVRDACHGDVTYEVRNEALTAVVQGDCGKQGEVSVRITNLGRERTTFTWEARVSIGDDSSDEPPEGAYVRARTLP